VIVPYRILHTIRWPATLLAQNKLHAPTWLSLHFIHNTSITHDQLVCIHVADDIDNAVSAELPLVPKRHEYPQTSIGQTQYDAATVACTRLTDRIVSSMLHRDCENHPTAACRQKDPEQCKDRYPRDFVAATVWDETKVTPEYRRRSVEQGGREFTQTDSKGHVRVVNNRWVVPYNRYLVLKYDCHINTEVRSIAQAYDQTNSQHVPR